MTFEEAVAAPGEKYQVSGRAKDGKRTVMIYTLGDDGAKQLGFTQVTEAEHAGVVADLSRRGLAIAETDWYCDFIWHTNADGIAVYNSEHRVFDATGNTATLEDFKVVRREDIAKVIAFASEDYIYRGAKALLRSGQEIPLVTEAASSAMGDPTYSRNELLMETGWAPKIAAAIATWAGSDFEDLI